jgi:uncharacterized membrane-anchored protein YjiN (DUF445 family)
MAPSSATTLRPPSKSRSPLAGWLLAAMALIFVFSTTRLGTHPLWDWVHAASEAGVVGGLADWFAVTALFRHPLGLKLPHTAIIPRQKDQLGANLGRFVEQHFLTPRNVVRKLAERRVMHAAAQWLAQPRNARRLAAGVAAQLPPLLERMGDEDVRRFLQRSLEPALRSLDVARASAVALEAATAEGRHYAVLDAALARLQRWLDEHRDLVRQKFGEASRYTPSLVDGYVANRVVDGAIALAREIAQDPQHELRLRFDESVRNWIAQLRSSREHRAAVESLKDDLLRHFEHREYWQKLGSALLDRLAADAVAPRSWLRRQLARTLAAAGHALLEDEPLLAKLETAWLGAAEVLLERHGKQVSALVGEVVRGWDGSEVAARVEAEIGEDLQYIRINGTVVGGLAGIALHAAGLLVAAWR